jgi:hypothetical protein
MVWKDTVLTIWENTLNYFKLSNITQSAETVLTIWENVPIDSMLGHRAPNLFDKPVSFYIQLFEGQATS